MFIVNQDTFRQAVEVSDQLSSTSMISYDFGRIVVVVIVGVAVALHVRESKLLRWSNAWTKAPNV